MARGWAGLVWFNCVRVSTESVGSGSEVQAGRQAVSVGLAVWLVDVNPVGRSRALFQDSGQSRRPLLTLMLNIFEVCSYEFKCLLSHHHSVTEVIVPYSLLMHLTGGTMTSYRLDKLSLPCGPE